VSITALVTGKLHAAPERRTGGRGKPFVRVALIAHDGEADAFVSVIAFGHVAEQLAALDKGEAVSVSGRAQIRTWEKNGETRAGLSVVADCLLTVHHVRRKRQAMAADEPERAAEDQRA
jgi:single-stranded DNA-binding protein